MYKIKYDTIVKLGYQQKVKKQISLLNQVGGPECPRASLLLKHPPINYLRGCIFESLFHNKQVDKLHLLT